MTTVRIPNIDDADIEDSKEYVNAPGFQNKHDHRYMFYELDQDSR